MSLIYAKMVLSGKMTIDQVPEIWREACKEKIKELQ